MHTNFHTRDVCPRVDTPSEPNHCGTAPFCPLLEQLNFPDAQRNGWEKPMFAANFLGNGQRRHGKDSCDGVLFDRAVGGWGMGANTTWRPGERL